MKNICYVNYMVNKLDLINSQNTHEQQFWSKHSFQTLKIDIYIYELWIYNIMKKILQCLKVAICF